MYKIYGIPNCNTVKKALHFFDQNDLEYEFINLKKNPPTQALIKKWKSAFGDWPVNKKGPTFRKLKDEFESSDNKGKIELMIEKSSAIKRPIVEKNGDVLIFGFNKDEYQTLR